MASTEEFSARIARLHLKSRALSGEPGVYLMRSADGTIIYVGKAKNLKNRVSSYFRALDRHHPKVLAMVEQVEDFETIVTTSEFEALVLECSLIKLHNPHYNILLKDDKGFSYLRVDKSDYPRISEVKQKGEDDATYIGPYLSSWVVKQTADEANKAFGLPTCNRAFPRDFKKERPCLNYHMRQCIGLCRGNISAEEYQDTVRQAIEYIKGGGPEAVKLITARMEAAAEALEFEKAARCRDRLRAIERFAQRQRLVYAGVADQDVLALAQSGDDIALCLLRFRGEKLVDKADFLFPGALSVEAARSEFLPRYYSDPLHELPALLSIDGELPDRELVEELLSQRAGRRVRIEQPQRGDRMRLIEMARLNAAEQLSLREGNRRGGRELAALDELGRLLGLEKPPEYIEAYDISNIGSDTFVGAMVVFEQGKPKRANYRRFAMKEVTTPDDYACMAQMLRRRFSRYVAQEPDGGAFNHRPDLLLIDGGKGHVSVALSVLDELGLAIPTFGMVKDDRHRTRAISAEGGEIAISSLRGVFTLVSSIQNETHRFAVEYARGSHQKSAFELSLTKVKGIGPAKARVLFGHFRTKKAILAATEEELAAVKGMDKRAARALREAVDSGELT